MSQEPSHASDEPKTEKVVCRRIHLTKSFWFFIFIFIVVVAIGFSVFWMSFVQVYHGVMDQVHVLHQQDRVLQQKSHKAAIDMQKQMLQLKSLMHQVDQHEAVLAHLTHREGSLPARWVVPEVHYLIQLANFSLIYEKNIPVAISLLKMADSYLAKVSDPNALKWRKRINQHIIDLQALPHIDVTGIYFRLSALDGLVDQLEFVQDRFQYHPERHVQVQTSWWRKVGSNLLETLKSLIVVRHHNKPEGSFLSDQFRQVLLMNLHVLISQTQWAILQQKDAVYQHSLMQMKVVLQKYFSQTDTHVQALEKAIDNLRKVNLVQSMPDLSDIVKEQDQKKTLHINKKHLNKKGTES